MRSSSMRQENSASATAALPPSNSVKEMSSGQSNVFKLLAQRELSPQTKRTPKRFWGKASRGHADSSGIKSELAKDAKQELRSWAEAESLLHLSAKYCPLLPPPRSTIAAAFSPDGKTLASTHGDHTVKIIDCRTGTCLKVLTGHRRTPWVVRFHPLYPEVVASGSLDHEVRLWDARTAACIGSRDFYRPIASIAFHAQGEFLAVASGHKLYIWHYSRRGEASSPIIILRTRRSLRAVHFHPHGAPFLLTAEPAVEDAMETDGQVADVANQFFPFGDPAHWELPFLQGWLIGQSQAMQPQNGGPTEGLSSYSVVGSPSRSGSRNRSSRSHTRPATGSGGDHAAAFNGIPPEQSDYQPLIVNQVQPEGGAELPCTVKLRIWSHDMKNPCAPLDTERCRLTIPHAVLCSEMGAHFSPCGRFLAACVACIQPNIDSDPGLQGQVQHDVTGASTSPTRHPISAQQVIYELRIYSLEEATFGSVLASRAIRAAHCLTSIQFSPTSEHLLLAYGRRHTSLLKSVVIDGDTTVSIYTILEIYRVSDMELVRVLPSAEDEVNVASFHPSVGGGFIYGTKEGKLRILQCDSSHGFNNGGSSVSDNSMPEVQRYAIEG